MKVYVLSVHLKNEFILIQLVLDSFNTLTNAMLKILFDLFFILNRSKKKVDIEYFNVNNRVRTYWTWNTFMQQIK